MLLVMVRRTLFLSILGVAASGIWTTVVVAAQGDTDPETPSCQDDNGDVSLKASVNFTFSKGQMDVLYEVSQLLRLVSFDMSGGRPVEDWNNHPTIQEKYEQFQGWSDMNDQSIVAKTHSGTCYAVFSESDIKNLFEQWQNIDPRIKRVGDSDCIVRRGFFNSYNTSYAEPFHIELQKCLKSCQENGNTHCPLVLSGISQGGSAAMAAAMDLRQYSPMTISFGAPPTILYRWDDCTDFDAANHYQFVNMVDGYYDQVALQWNPQRPGHLGKFLLLGDDIDDMENTVGTITIAYPADNILEDYRRPRSYDAHDPDLYVERIERIYRRGCFPVPVGRWGAGHRCNYHDECASGVCTSTDKICHAK